MPYVPTVWVNGVTPVDQARMNNLEKQYDEVVTDMGPVLAVQASDLQRNSNDTLRTTVELAYTKVKEVLLNADLVGSRIKFTLASSDGNVAFGRIYKNGVAIGIARNTAVSTEFSEDFSSFVNGDLIQIYAHGTTGNESRVSNMRFCYTKNVTAFGSDTLTTPLATTTDPTISMTNQDP